MHGAPYATMRGFWEGLVQALRVPGTATRGTAARGTAARGTAGRPRRADNDWRGERHKPGRRRFLATALLISLLAAWALPVAATTDPRVELGPDHKRVAFVVGNSAYQKLPRLVNPRRDAEAIADSLERLGFLVTRVIDGDAETLLRALADFTEQSRGSDIALVYYAGHGVQVNGENYILPVSLSAADASTVLNEGLGMSAVRRQLQTADAGLNIVILDSCRENPFGPIVTEQTAESATPLIVRQGLAQMRSAAGMLIAYATQPGDVAYDGQDSHSPFTASLLRFIEAPGLEIRLMLGRVREDVVARTNGVQIPWVEEAVLGEFYFADDDKLPLAGDRAEQELTFWHSIWRSDDRHDYEAYLARYPDGTFRDLAKNRLSALRLTEAEDAGPIDQEDWSSVSADDRRAVKNSLYWLGYYNGPLTGSPDNELLGAVQAFKNAVFQAPGGWLTPSQSRQLHFAAANALIARGERLAERIIFDRARLRSIDRGVNDIALPAYEELKQRLAGKDEGAEILAEAEAQIAAIREKRDSAAGRLETATQQYLTAVTAAGSGYESEIKVAGATHVRAPTSQAAGTAAQPVRRKIFMQQALDYAEKGAINEAVWIEEILQ